MNRKEFIVVLIITFAVGMVWLISDITHANSSFTPDPKVKEVLENKVNPTFNTQTLEQISTAATPAPLVVITPGPSTAPTSTPKASPKVATPSPTLRATSSPSATPK